MFVNEMYNFFTNCVGCVGWNGKISLMHLEDNTRAHWSNVVLIKVCFSSYQ